MNRFYINRNIILLFINIKKNELLMFIVWLFIWLYIYCCFLSVICVILVYYINCVNGSILKKIFIISLKG